VRVGEGNGRIEFRFFSTITNLTSFGLKLRGRYTPGLESVQASILHGKFGLFRLDIDRMKLAKG